ncbi:hypothetical protein [Mycoplasma sp. Mirounga ES2805-ORL]|uniref:hypothetical protein n=1 Tax=Mycoplasma sp. Mirounga ES2805-ORL TaxID=754514 RepID=UPI00197C67FC|nr:hypothetical protein [Mycoplasma sp. Mirounga ES2805-ORL]QSF13914.1 hypothetical protein JXZ90_01265 [Mycoplasma sp. Mirounga ES2805-ORL]
MKWKMRKSLVLFPSIFIPIVSLTSCKLVDNYDDKKVKIIFHDFLSDEDVRKAIKDLVFEDLSYDKWLNTEINDFKYKGLQKGYYLIITKSKVDRKANLIHWEFKLLKTINNKTYLQKDFGLISSKLIFDKINHSKEEDKDNKQNEKIEFKPSKFDVKDSYYGKVNKKISRSVPYETITQYKQDLVKVNQDKIKSIKKFESIFDKVNESWKVDNNSKKEVDQVWNNFIDLYFEVENIVKNNFNIFANNPMFTESIKEFLKSQEKSNKFVKEYISSATYYIEWNEFNHFRTIINTFIAKNDKESFDKYYKFVGGFYVFNVLKDVEKFVDLQIKNRDLAFDFTKDGYVPNVKNLDIFKNVDERTLDTRKLLLEKGGLDDNNKPIKFTWNLNSKHKSFVEKHINKNINDLKIRDEEIQNSLWKYELFKIASDNSYLGYMGGNARTKGMTIRYDKINKEWIGIDLGYRHLKEEWIPLKNYVLKVIPFIISKNFTEEQIIRSVHNFIIWKINYDFERTEKEIKTRIPDFGIRNPSVFYQSPKLLDKVNGVCETYARVFELFMTFLDIKSWYITGDVYRYKLKDNNNPYTAPFMSIANSEPHAWNLVYSRTQNKYLWIDLTWDDNSYDNQSKNPFNNSLIIPFKYEYYLQPWETFAKQHDQYGGILKSSLINKKWSDGTDDVFVRNVNYWYFLMNELEKEFNNKQLFELPKLENMHPYKSTYVTKDKN